MVRRSNVDPDRIECDACHEPAVHLDYRNEPKVSMRACINHNDLAAEYKSPGGEIHPEAKVTWEDSATKLNPKVQEVANQLMSPERDGSYGSRRLNHDQKYIDRGIDGAGYGL